MDAIYFLKKRTDFIRFYYDTSAKPFAETRRCIEEKLPPYTPQSPPKMLGDTRRAGGDSSTPPQSPNSGFARTNEISPSRPVFDRPAGGMEY